MSIRTYSITLVLALTAAAVACGGSDTGTSTSSATPAPSAAAPRDPCVLLTEEDARRALDRDVKRTDPANMSGMAMCQYIADSSESVTLQFRAAAPSDFDEYVKQSVEMLGATVQQVEGVGERAVLAGDQFIFLNKGHMYVILLGRNLPAAEKMTRTRQLASTVLGRL